MSAAGDQSLDDRVVPRDNWLTSTWQFLKAFLPTRTDYQPLWRKPMLKKILAIVAMVYAASRRPSQWPSSPGCW